MKIFFLNPSGDYPNQFPPLGILYLASMCRKNGHTVFFYDLAAKNANQTEFICELVNSGAEILCISLYTTGILNTFALIKKVKRLLPNIIIIVGGPHVSALPLETMQKCLKIDYTVIGEGETTLQELIENIELKVNFISRGICYINKIGEIIKTMPRRRITELDFLPFPAFDLVERFKYSYDKFSVGKKVGMIITSRGCPYNCTFCNKAVFGTNYIRRSPENVVKEILYQKQHYKIDEIYFVDDLFVSQKTWMNSFFTLYNESKINLPWKCLGRVDKADYNIYKRMKEAGCFLVQFGVESGNERMLTYIDKGITLNQARKAISDCKKAGLCTATYFIIGHPEETTNTALDTINFAKELNADVCHFFVMVPFPGTRNYSLLPENLKCQWDRIQYYHKNNYPISLCEIKSKVLYLLEKQARYEFYGRWKYFKENILSLRGPLKIVFKKAGISIISFAMKWYLHLSNKRIVNKLNRSKI